jgi:hypothetical protein
VQSAGYANFFSISGENPGSIGGGSAIALAPADGTNSDAWFKGLSAAELLTLSRFVVEGSLFTVGGRLVR